METHTVCRPFTADKPLKVGEKVDASEWPNAGILEDQRFIRPISTMGRQGTVPAKTKTTASRKGAGKRS